MRSSCSASWRTGVTASTGARTRRGSTRCRNSWRRSTDGGYPLLLVPVAAILVASIRLRFVDVLLHLRYLGPNRIDCSATAAKGAELGWFEHGSTIVVLAPKGFSLCEGVQPGLRVCMGSALMALPPPALALPAAPA